MLHLETMLTVMMGVAMYLNLRERWWNWQMDIDGDKNIMHTENAYFDATHSQIHGFKSFGL